MQPLVEKYRPKSFDDLVGNAEAIKEIKAMIESRQMPHLLLYGSPGTGKTSLANVICRALYPSNARGFKEINASDANGIETIRNDVKDFASHSSSQDNVEFRTQVLDECDEMTTKAQPALRRIMEIYSRHCRFILICNYEWKIIAPIRSRCKQVQLHAIRPDEMIPRLEYICKEEKIDIEKDALAYIAEQSNGDMRIALNNYLESALIAKKKIDVAFLKGIQQDNADFLSILRDALNGKFMQARQSVLALIKQGSNVRQLIAAISNSCYAFEKFPELMKGDIAESHLRHELAILDGANEMSVISAFIAALSGIGSKWKSK